jgi:hypothetical protein
VLIEYDGRIVQRALPQQPGQKPPELPASPAAKGPKTDYLAILRDDYEKRVQAELRALDLRPAAAPKELALIELVALVEGCRGARLKDRERSDVAALFRKLRPIDPDAARKAFDAIRRRLGTALHLRVYLDAFQATMVRRRTKKGETK